MPTEPRMERSVRMGATGCPAVGETPRSSGLDRIGGIPWGTHFCQFYETPQDLIDLLVPYFQAGLERNEFCLWVASEPLAAQDAEAVLRRGLPDWDEYLRRGQIEILDHRQGYAATGKFDPNRAIACWIEKEQRARQRGCEGLRLAGNAFWLEQDDWKEFADYEVGVDQVITSRRILALCCYAVRKCSAPEVIQVTDNHQFALIKRAGRWEVMESRHRQRAEEEIAHRNAVLEGINRIFREAFAGETEEQIGRLCLKVVEAVTNSKFGFIGELNPQTGLMDDLAISDPDWEACRMDDPAGHGTRLPVQFKIHGIYGRVLKDGKGFYTNDPSSHPDRIGTPEGHPPLTAFLGVPLVHDGKTIGMVGVGNRAGGYRDADLAALEALAGPIVQVLMRRRADEQIQQLNRELEERVDHRTKQLHAVNQSLQQEIAEHIKTEQAMSGLAAIVESSEDAIAGKTLDGIVTSWNQAAERMYGYAAAEMVGKSIEVLTPPDRPGEISRILQKIRRGERIKDFETVRRRKDGQCIDVSLTVSPVKDASGQIVGAAGIARDITQRKRLEEEVRAASSYARSLIEASLDPFVTISPAGKITDVNKATELATGATRECLIGSDFSSYFTEPDRADQGYRRVLAEGLVRDYALTIRHASGQTMDVLYNAVVYRNDAGELQGVFAAARDITAQKAIERRQTMINSLLELFVRKATRKEYLGSVVEVLRDWSGCRCVGIRVADGRGDAPHEAAVGFGPEFWESQALLCLRRQSCICMRVVSGAPEPQDVKWLTPAGSFRTDNAAQFAASLTAEEQARCQGACLRAGLLSVAVVPIRYRQETLGAIQLADEREGIATPAGIEFIESMAPLIGEALHRFNAEAELTSHREHLEELVRQRTDELQRSESLLRSVTNNTQDGIYVKDRHSRLLFINPAVSRLVDRPADQILGHTDAELFDDPAIGAAILENDQHIMTSGVPQVFEETIVLPHGRRVMLSSKVPWRDSQNQVIGIIGVSRDITERKQAEDRVALLARVTSQLLATHEPQQVVESLCREVMACLDCQVFFNFLLDESSGRLRLNACGGVPEEESRRIEWLDPGVAVCGCVARDGCRIVAENIQVTPDPRTDLVRSHGVQAYACHPLVNQGHVIGTISFGARNRPTFTEQELGLMKTVADHVAIAMQRIRLLQSLERHARAAEAASQAKSQFLANMSHELRTPMNAIMGMIDMAMPRTIDPAVQDCLQTAKGSADLLLTLLDDLLDSVKIEAGKLQLKPAPFPLRRTLDQIVRVLSLRANERGLQFRCRTAGELPDAVVGDRMRLQQVLLNLAGNALKFTERGEVEIAVAAQSQDGHACLEFAVRDTGIGVPAHELERIFEPFAQADASMTRRFGGTGLGLSIAKSLVEMMGGRIWAQSRPGKGSTFHFAVRLPLAKEAGSTDPTPVTLPAARAPLRILLAEDNPGNQKVATYILEKRGHVVEIANDGREAVRLTEQDRYDVIVMDVQMPGMNGLEATAAIRRRDAGRRRVPIIAMTAHAMKSDQQRCLAAGMDGYLSKPVNAQEMIDLIESLARGAGESPLPSAAAPAPVVTPPAPETIFNPEEAVHRCFNNAEMARDMIRCFFEEVERLFPRMHAALRGKDLAELGRLGHRMKGTVVYLGAGPATQAAVRVERFMHADGWDPSDAEQAVNDLERQCAVLGDVLRTHPLAVGPK